MSEWDNIKDLKGWRNKLKSLLAEAKEVAKAGDLDERLDISERLTQFAEWSWPNSDEIKALDKIAGEAARSVLIKEIEGRLAAIQARSAEYARLEKQVSADASANDAAAASIRMDNIIGAIDATRTTVETFNKLKDSLKDTKSEQKIAEAIDEMIVAIEALRSKIGKLL